MSTPEEAAAAAVKATLDRILSETQALYDLVADQEERAIRTETRLVKLMIHQGLDASGQPVAQ